MVITEEGKTKIEILILKDKPKKEFDDIILAAINEDCTNYIHLNKLLSVKYNLNPTEIREHVEKHKSLIIEKRNKESKTKEKITKEKADRIAEMFSSFIKKDEIKLSKLMEMNDNQIDWMIRVFKENSLSHGSFKYLAKPEYNVKQMIEIDKLIQDINSKKAMLKLKYGIEVIDEQDEDS